ncbi:MAG: diguanylate cyclase [Candidatus Thiodiazotropha sp. (ex. Lucinisca nassula)]|nr:diguanylate cyclase [Candidatus Thiodiazotropha sp. (ex. Lucinisca nassula)]
MSSLLKHSSIRTLFLAVAIGGITFFGVSIWFLVQSYYRSVDLSHVQRVATVLTTDGFRLALFTHDALTGEYTRSAQQWHAAHDQLRATLESHADLLKPYSRQIDVINSTLDAMLPIMDTVLIKRSQLLPSEAKLHNDKTHALLISQVAIRNAELQSAVTELERIVSHDVEQSLGISWNSLYLTLLMIFIIVILASTTVWVLFYKRVQTPILSMVSAITRLKMGDKAFRPTKLADDELGEVITAFNSLLDQRDNTELRLEKQNNLIDCIGRLREQFIREPDPLVMFDAMLKDLLSLTNSEFGFISEVLKDENSSPYMKAWAFSNISWNDETRQFYNENKEKGFEFHKLDNLFGRVITSGQVVISNDPTHDERCSGTPPGHPDLNAFLSIPVYYGDDLVGEVGLANRPGGYDKELEEWIAPATAAIGQIIVARWDRNAKITIEKDLRQLAMSDPLTGISNRRQLNYQLNYLLASSKRYEENLSLLMLDIDHFKNINDTYGHDTGDSILFSLVELIKPLIREVDQFARWGGEEFIIVLPKTDIIEGANLAERIRRQVEDINFPAINHLTISIGVTAFQKNDTHASIIKRADDALYEAKNTGRNRVILKQ